MIEILRLLSESLTSIGDLTPIEASLAAAEAGCAILALALLRASARRPEGALRPAHPPALRKAA